MRMLLVSVAGLLIGCARTRPATSSGEPVDHDTSAPAGEREICRVGRAHSGPDVKARPCAQGLECCYPCGVDGCDSVCMRTCPVGIP